MTPCAVEASGRGSSITPPLRPAHASRLISEKRALIHDSGPIQVSAKRQQIRPHSGETEHTRSRSARSVLAATPPRTRKTPRRGVAILDTTTRAAGRASFAKSHTCASRRADGAPRGGRGGGVKTRRGELGGAGGRHWHVTRGRQRRRVRGVPCTNRPRAGRVVVRNRRGIVRFSRVTVAALSHLQENRRCPRALHFTARLLSKLSFFLAQHLPHGGLTALCNLFDEGQPGSFGALQW